MVIHLTPHTGRLMVIVSEGALKSTKRLDDRTTLWIGEDGSVLRVVFTDIHPLTFFVALPDDAQEERA